MKLLCMEGMKLESRGKSVQEEVVSSTVVQTGTDRKEIAAVTVKRHWL